MQSYGIMFHHFHGGNHQQSQGSIKGEQLVGIIEHYKSRLLPAGQWSEKARAGTLKDEICLTFDDNLRCQYDIAYPILTRYGLTGFWFISSAILDGRLDMPELYQRFRNRYFATMEDFYQVFFSIAGHEQKLREFDPSVYLKQYPFYTDNDRRFRFLRDEVMSRDEYAGVMAALLEREGVKAETLTNDLWMGEDQLRDLWQHGHQIGLHTHTHPTNLAQLSVAEQRTEYEQNKATLKRVLGVAADCVSHPCGSYNQDTLDILAKLDITLGFRDDMTSGKTLLELPRQDHANIVKELGL